MKKKLFLFLLMLAISGITGLGFISPNQAEASGSNKVIITEPGNYVFKPEWYNTAGKTWISKEPSFRANLAYQYNSTLIKLDRSVVDLTPASKLLIVDAQEPKNNVEILDINKVYYGRWLLLKTPLKYTYKQGSIIKTYLKNYSGYFPNMGEDVDLGDFDSGKELVFSHLTYWNSRWNRTGHLVFGPSYSTNSRYYRITQLSPTSWRFEFDDGVGFDGGYNDGSFIVEKKGAEAGALHVITSTTNPPEGARIIKGAATSSVLAEVTYEATDSGEDVEVRKIRIEDQPGNGGKSLYVDNVKIYDKNTGREIVPDIYPDFDATRPNENDYIDFDLTGSPLIVPKGSVVTLLIKGVINASETAGVMHSFGNATSTVGVIARGVDTGEAITETYVNTFGNPLTVVNQGVMTIKKSYNSPVSKLLIAGTTKQTLAVFEVGALDEDITLDQLTLTFTVNETRFTSPNDITTLYLYDDNGNIIASTNVNATTTTFRNLGAVASPFVVPNGGSRGLYVKADLAEVGVDEPGTSGHKIGYKIAGPQDFIGKGAISGAVIEVIGTGAQSPIGSTFTLVKGAPVITYIPLSGPESKLAGREDNKTIYRFSIGANALGGDVGVYKMMFKVSTNKASATNFYLYDVTSQERINYTSSSVDLDSEGLLTFYLDSDGYPGDSEKEEQVIASGATRKYELRANTYESASSTADMIIVNMLYDTSQGPYPAKAETIDNNGFRFIWSDRSAPFHATITSDWYNGYLVTGQATSTGTALTD